jgi:hypothetical protein
MVFAVKVQLVAAIFLPQKKFLTGILSLAYSLRGFHSELKFWAALSRNTSANEATSKCCAVTDGRDCCFLSFQHSIA